MVRDLFQQTLFEGGEGVFRFLQENHVAVDPGIQEIAKKSGDGKLLRKLVFFHSADEARQLVDVADQIEPRLREVKAKADPALHPVLQDRQGKGPQNARAKQFRLTVFHLGHIMQERLLMRYPRGFRFELLFRHKRNQLLTLFGVTLLEFPQHCVQQKFFHMYCLRALFHS